MRACCYRRSSVVCVYVCWSRSWALQKRMNRSRCWLDRLDRMDQRNHVLEWSRDPPREWTFFWGEGGLRPIEKHQLGVSATALSVPFTTATMLLRHCWVLLVGQFSRWPRLAETVLFRSDVGPSGRPVFFLTLIGHLAHTQRDTPGVSTRRGQRTFSVWVLGGRTTYVILFYRSGLEGWASRGRTSGLLDRLTP